MMKQKSKTSIDLSKPILKVNNEPLQRSKERVAAKTAEKNARKYIIAEVTCLMNISMPGSREGVGCGQGVWIPPGKSQVAIILFP